ncbi:HotDog domain-containing protein [Suillus ampliporus]|nr:HotDog domain-containing protein [Suillus ampliporus]
MGYDAGSLWEQIIVWGHQDASRHVNNAHYLRFIESGYVMWCMAIGKALGGEERVKAILAGQGVSFILKSVNVNFKRPVTFPDTFDWAQADDLFEPHALHSELSALFVFTTSDRCGLGQRACLSLQDAFQDPSSPFHIAPGQTGPESADAPPPLSQVPHPTSPQPSYSTAVSSPAENARAKLISMGYDAGSLWEQSIVWGHHDAFRHVNNVHYLRFIESGRIPWVMAFGKALGGEERANAMLAGQGVSIILKSVNVNFKRPVTFPDTLLIGHKPMISSSRTHFTLNAVLYSYSQQAIVADSDSVLVWYDYDNLKKCDPGDDAWRILKAASQDGQVKN